MGSFVFRLFPCLLPPLQRKHGNFQSVRGKECLRMRYRVKDKAHEPIFPPLTAGVMWCDVMLSCHGPCSLLLVLPQELQLPAGRWAGSCWLPCRGIASLRIIQVGKDLQDHRLQPLHCYSAATSTHLSESIFSPENFGEIPSNPILESSKEWELWSGVGNWRADPS